MIKKIFPSLSSLGSDGNTAFLRAARAGHLDKVLDHLKNNVDINTSNTNGLNALHLASKDGHIDVVTELLKRGANVDSATKKGNTALHIASLAGQEDVVKLLVEHGASVNVQSQNGFTPLYMAAQENHDSVVKFLLTNNANQSLATEDGFTPLAVAMQQGHDKVVAVLLENDSRGKVRLPALHIAAKKDDCKAAALLLQNEHNPDVTSKSGFTPLHIASHYGNEGIAQLLLSKSADVNYSAKHNITPLHVAAKWGKANMVALLLDRGANIEAKTRDGLTPLHCAARSGHEQVVDMLLERGAPISSKTKNGLAPLHMASQGDHVDAARILLYHRAPVDDVTVDYLTALHVAAHCGHAAVARLLLDRKADPNARALNGFTPLHIACKKNRIKVVELLLKHGASIEATTESGLTPLHVASFMGCMNIVIYLVQNEASPDVTTVRGETPLHLAARANQTDIIRILLRNGAHVSARAREQQTPLHIASRLGNVDIVMLLLQHGANVDCTTKDLYTPLHIAAKEGQEEVASVLVENGASLEAQTKKGFTPLHLAAKYGNMKVAKLLLQKDAPVDAQGKNGVTSLHVASHYDHQNVALLLLEKGASPHATAKNGHTPLHIAARKNQMDIATTLLEYGAKAETESKAGFTPLHLSSQEGHTDMTTLLLDHHADPNHKAKNGLTPLHLCAQEDRVEVASILLKNQAEIDATTKAGYTPLHVASHFGQANMVRLLLAEGASVKNTTAVNYTPLHQAAQQGHAGIVTTLLQSGADPNQTTNQGQTALSIAQKLGYISVVESLKGVTEAPAPPPSNEDKYKVVAPETMQETFMSDSEDEGGEDTAMAEQPYHYLTVDEMKTLGDDSLPIDVTRDTEHHADNRDLSGPPVAIDEQPSPTHVKESYSQYTAMDNVEIAKHAQHIGFLVSFLVDARGGAMRGCRHSGVRVIVPPRRAPAPLRITCRYLKRDKMPHPPPLMEGEALASRILELAPVAAKFLAPIMIEVPHFASLRNKEREIVILRSDNGETWREHTFEASEEAIQEILSHSFDKEELSQLEESPRTSRILMTELPHYLAVVSRVKQEVHAIGPEGGMVSSTVVPQVQAVFPQGALTKKIKVGLQAQPIPMELTAKLLGNRVAVSPIVTVEPRRRKFHKPITLTIPVPQAASKGMINTYSGDAPTLRLLCSITGGTSRAQWEDVTGSTPLTFVNDCVSFTTTVSARFWLMDCRNIEDATKMATELYREAIHVPFMAKFVVFAKRTDMSEARLRVFCMTDDKEDKTLEHQEQFTEVAKSRDVEVLEGKTQYVEFAGNLVPITKSGDQLQLGFRAFKENRLPFTVKVKDPHADAIGRILFMREPKVAKGDAPQQPMCILNIVLPDNIIPEPLTPDHDGTRTTAVPEGVPSWQRLTEVSESLGDDWIRLAGGLDVSMSQVNRIKTEYCDSSPAQQGLLMLKQWVQDAGNKASGSTLEEALRKIGRYDIVERCLYNEDQIQVSTYGQKVEIINKQIYPSPLRDINRVEATVTKKQDTLDKDKDDKEEKKYSAEEKEVDELEMKKSVSERKREIERRISEEQDKKKEPSPPPPVTLRRSESKERKESQSLKKDDKDELSKSEKETCEEKSISPEPANLSFDEKRRSFELGRLIKEKPEKKADLTQKFIDSEKVVYQMTSEEPEQELSFQEKRLSFEKGLIKSIEEKPEILDSKIIKKIQMETIVSTETTTKPITEEKVIVETTKDAKFLEGVAKGLSDFKEKEILVSETQGIISPKLSTTPPPSPADVLKAKAGEIEWKSTPTSDIDGAPPKSPIQKADEPSNKLIKETEKGEDVVPPIPSPRQVQSKTPSQSSVDEPEAYTVKKTFWENLSSSVEEETKSKEASHPPVPRPRLSISSSQMSEDIPEKLAKSDYSETSAVSEASAIDISDNVHSSLSATAEPVVSEQTDECTDSQGIESESELDDVSKEIGYDNAAFVEDPVIGVTPRPMSIALQSKRTAFERSVSLPCDASLDEALSSVHERKRLFEEKIKKEMVVEQLMTHVEEDSPPEYKAIEQLTERTPTDHESMASRQIHTHIFEHELDEQIEPSPPECKEILESAIVHEEPSRKLDEKIKIIEVETGFVEEVPPPKDVIDKVDSSRASGTFVPSTLTKENLELKDTLESRSASSCSSTSRRDLSSGAAEIMHYKNDIISKPSDSLEVHIDKSELEENEKLKEYEDLERADSASLPSNNIVSHVDGRIHAAESRSSSRGESEDTFSESDVTPEDTRFKEKNMFPEWEKDSIKKCEGAEPASIQVYTPEEHIPDTVWEVPVQQEIDSAEEVQSMPSQVIPTSLCLNGKSGFSDYNDSSVDAISKNEAVVVAESLIEDIEAEIAVKDVTTPERPTISEISFDNGESTAPIDVSQDESKKRIDHVMLFRRTDTATSSMDITDEDLRSSGGVETDISPLESQAGKLFPLEDHSEAETVEELEHHDDDFDENVPTENKEDEVSKGDLEVDVVEKTLAEVRESLEAVKEELIEEKKKKKDSITKESPSEFEIKGITMEKRFDESITEHHHEETPLSYEEVSVVKADTSLTEEIIVTTETADRDSSEHSLILENSEKESKLGDKVPETVTSIPLETQIKPKVIAVEKSSVVIETVISKSNVIETSDVLTISLDKEKIKEHVSSDIKHETSEYASDKESPKSIRQESYKSSATDASSVVSPSDSVKSDSPALIKQTFETRFEDSPISRTEIISSLKTDPRSGTDYSSSGESHYHSFDQNSDSGHTSSRPLSSDVEGLLANVGVITGSSEYESAATHALSSHSSAVTSHDFQTAISSLSSKESMKSFDSESSGNLASLEVSSASETLVPSAMELENDMENVSKMTFQDQVQDQVLQTEDSAQLDSDNYDSQKVSEDIISLSESQNRSISIESDQGDDISEDEVDLAKNEPEYVKKMTRSIEMTFHPEPRAIISDSIVSESQDDKICSSLDDVGSFASSFSDAPTVIPGVAASHSSYSDDLSTSPFSVKTISKEDISFDRKLEETEFSKSSLYGKEEEKTEIKPEEPTLTTNASPEQEIKKRSGHKRNGSTVFVSSSPQIAPKIMEGIKEALVLEKTAESILISEDETLLENVRSPSFTDFSPEDRKIRDELLGMCSDRKSPVSVSPFERPDSPEPQDVYDSQLEQYLYTQKEAMYGSTKEPSDVDEFLANIPPDDSYICTYTADTPEETFDTIKFTETHYDPSCSDIPGITITEPDPLSHQSSYESNEEILVGAPTIDTCSRETSPETFIEKEIETGERSIILEENESGLESSSFSRSEDKGVYNLQFGSRRDSESLTDSPTSDSFELLEKPDISDEFVIIEEVGKEAEEQDREGKSVRIQSVPIPRPRIADEDKIVSPPPTETKLTKIKYYAEGCAEIEGAPFLIETGHVSDSQAAESVSSEGSPPSDNEETAYEQELEASKKWMEMQFQGEPAAVVYGYGIELGPLEDIKEEELTDFENSSKIGSMGSQVSQSIGSLGSAGSVGISSTPDYDVLAGKKYFSRSGDHDDISMSSLQEFERLEKMVQLESSKNRSSGSQDSLTSSSNSNKKVSSRSGGDDLSLASLKEFEGLENACIEVVKIERKAKAEEEALLSEIEEGHESQASESESCITISAVGMAKGESEEEDIDNKMFEIDEIIRQAQANVEKGPADFFSTTITSLPAATNKFDSLEEVARVPDLDLDKPFSFAAQISKTTVEKKYEIDEELITSTDSLDLKTQISKLSSGKDSLDQKSVTSSQKAPETFTTTGTTSSKSQESFKFKDTMEQAGEWPEYTSDSECITSPIKDLSSTSHHTSRSIASRSEYMLGSTDSLEPTSSNATHATYQYETDSVMSSSFTSGDSNTMVGDTDFTSRSGIWYDDGKPYVTEVIEPGDDEFSHVIHRTVEMPPEIYKVTFKGGEADSALEQYIEQFQPGEDMFESEEIGEDGNVHIKRVIQKRIVIKPEEFGSDKELTKEELEAYLKLHSKDVKPDPLISTETLSQSLDQSKTCSKETTVLTTKSSTVQKDLTTKEREEEQSSSSDQKSKSKDDKK